MFRKMKWAILPIAAVVGILSFSSFVDDGESGAPALCLEIHLAVYSQSPVDEEKCYHDAPGSDVFEGNTQKCIIGTGSCNKVTCDKQPKPSCYTEPL